MLKKLNFTSSMKTYKDIIFIIGNWSVKVETQEIPEITGKCGLGVQNEVGQSLQSFVKRIHWS